MGLLWKRRSELHPEQIQAIEGLDIIGKYILLGPPGCGKTSILLHRGQYLRGAGGGLPNIRLITFSRTLREFIALNGDDRLPPALIQTMRSFVGEIFASYHEASPGQNKGQAVIEANRERAIACIQLLSRQDSRVLFEALLIDEVQDLVGEEIHLINSLSKSHMFAGDIRQRLFDASGAFEALDELGYKTIHLKHHFRVSPHICKVADNISILGNYRLQDHCNYVGLALQYPRRLEVLIMRSSFKR